MNRSIACLFLSVALISSCNNTPKSTQGEEKAAARDLFPISNDPENPSSLSLRLLDKTEGDTSISYVAKGIYQDDTIGFILEVNKDIPAGINTDGSINEEAGFQKGAIKFIRSGAMSDRFVSALGELWQIQEVERMKTQPIEPLVFSSNKTAVNHGKPSTSSFKLFFGEDTPTPGELFFTVDTYLRTIEFREKGTQYRSQIVHAFAE